MVHRPAKDASDGALVLLDSFAGNPRLGMVRLFSWGEVDWKEKPMTESELWNRMMDGKGKGPYLFPQAFATLSRPITLRKWRGHNAVPEYDLIPLLAGTKVRVVMASRFGDVGITDDLAATSGYHYRTTCVPDDQGTEPAGLLENIEMIERKTET